MDDTPTTRPPRPYPPAIHHGDPEVSAWFRRARTPAEIVFSSGGTCEILATGAQTDGRFGLYRWTFGEDESGPDPHFHRTITEQFCILDGEVRLHDGTGWTTAGPGDFLYVPAGGIHGFRGAHGASMLLMFAPGAPREDYFRTLASGPPTDADALDAFLRAHDNHYL